MERESIIRKINALMQVTIEHGATIHEALTAASMAQKLMAKHHIDSIDIASDKEDISEEEIHASRKWIQQFINIVANNMCCKVLIKFINRKAILTIIGRESDRKIVTDTANMLINVCKQGIRKEKISAKNKFGESAGVEIAYTVGFIKAVHEEMSKQCKALMLVIPKEVDEYIAETYNAVKNHHVGNKVRYRNEESITTAQQNGYNDGKNLVGQKLLNSN